jgi:hypothetical protein
MTIIQHKRGLSTNWESSNPTLSISEIGYEIDTGNFKIGDGVNAWLDLPYFQAGGTTTSGSGSGSGTVTSVDITLPTGLVVSGNPITTDGTLAVAYDTGYVIPTTAKQTEWDTAYGWGDHALAGYVTSFSETDTLSSVTGRGATTNTAISITNNTSSTTTTTGALKVTGGVGIQENLNVGGNLTVTGDFTILGTGTTTTINSTVVTIDDPIFVLGGDTAPGSDDNKDRGIAFRWYSGTAKIGFFGFDDSSQQFTFIPDATITSEVVSGATGTIAANLNGNATSADTLSTARNIWGQSFNGSGDVTGSLTNVGDITSSDATFSIGTTSVTTVSGNAIGITAGTTNNTIGTGGSVSVTGGSATASTGAVFGGNVNIAGGASTLSSSGTGGSVSILAGNGNIKGTISIGTSNTSGITIGASGITTTIVGTLSATLNALTISSPLSGTSYNGSSAVSIGLSTGYGDTQNPYAAKAIKTFLAGPAGGVSGSPIFRVLETTDIPDLSGTYLTTSGTASNSTNINISTTNGNTSDTTLYPVFVGANTTGAQAPHTDIAGIIYNASTESLSLTGNLTVTGGDVLLGGTGTATTIKTLATTGTSSGSLTIATGDTTTSGTSGNISIDVGNGASSEGTISIGTGNASAITIGKTGTITTIAGTLSATVSSTTAVVATVTGTNSAELVRGNMADNDQFRILVGGTGTNAGFAEIATADDGTEPIYIRQYTGVFGTLLRTATILDGSGNTTLPGTLTIQGSSLLTNQTTFNLINTTATTLNIGGGATTAVNIGASGGLINFAGGIDLRAGGTAANTAPLYFSSSTSLLSTTVAGAMEYNNKALYFTPDTTPGRALVATPFYKIIATDNSSLINVSPGVPTTYSVFGTNGIALDTGVSYEVEMVLLLSASAVSNSSTLVITPGSPTGAATPSSSQLYYDYSASTTVMTNAAATSSVLRTGTTTFPALNTITISTGTTQYVKAFMKGIINIATGGNFTIRMTFTPTSPGTVTGTVYAGSYLKITPLGSEAVTDVGTWA